jgi:nitric oxide reductase NorD protein
MSEPEDLILDGAYVASRFARDVWRRYAQPTDHKALSLRTVRTRLELLLHALFEREMPVRTANPGAPVSWLARLARRGGGSDGEAACGTDGVAVYLPATLDGSVMTGRPPALEDALPLYTLLAVEQGVRIARGSAAIAARIQDDEGRHRYAIAEATAADAWIVRETPGLVPALRSARRQALAGRRVLPASRGGRWIEELVRDWLGHDPDERCDWVPLAATPAESLAWALDPRSRTEGKRDRVGPEISPVFYWGRFLPPSTPLGAKTYADPYGPGARQKERRVAEMRRRPRVREAADDEDDPGAGTWVVRADEPQESVEDPFGLQRPTDRDAHADPEGLGDALSDLPEARVVRTPGQAREVLRSGEELQRSPTAAERTIGAGGISYPEWDYRSTAYVVPGAIVREIVPPAGDRAWADAARSRHRLLIRRVRTRFERLRPRRVRVGRQADGPELDLAEYVNAAADWRAGVSVEDRLYVEMRRARRELSVALLVDASASTDAWVSGTHRIIDVEKDAVLVVLEALAALGDRHAIYAFSGEGAERVAVLPLKRFAETSNPRVMDRISALDADGYTRIGAAIRHVTAAIVQERTDRRLLLVLSDGKPNDVDEYEGRYGVEDARQAVAEARSQNVDVFCLTVDRHAPRYAKRIFGSSGFTVLQRPDQLPQVLVEALRRLIRPGAS